NTNRWPYRNMYFGGAHAVAQQIAPNGAELWAAAGDRRRGGTAKLIV
ncbi:MAG: hypothetical protein GY796_31170, partial [Chloroflexi bacterium]|nr:hypothetical protein [Chloroflexota bacterium]